MAFPLQQWLRERDAVLLLYVQTLLAFFFCAKARQDGDKRGSN
jgi:hypothetical protein